MIRLSIMLSALLSASSVAQSQTLAVDKPWPSDFAKRLYISPEDLGGVRERMERVVGYWGIRKGNVIMVSGDQPASFSTGSPSITTVKLKELKPIYSSIITDAKSLEAGIPVLSIKLSKDERAQIKVTEVAQFESSRMPTSADWNTVRAAVGNPDDVVFISSAVVTSVESTTLSSKSASGRGLIQLLTLGGKSYRSSEESTTTLVVSVTATRPLISIAKPAIATTSPGGVQVALRRIVRPGVTKLGIVDGGIATIAK